MRWTPLARRASLAAVVLLLFLLVAGASTQTRVFREWVRTLLVRHAGQVIDGELSIGRIDGALWGRAEVFDVAVRDTAGVVASIERLEVVYSPWALVTGEVVVDRLVLDRPVVTLTQHADGRWNVAALVRERPGGDAREPGRRIELRDLQVRDAVVTVRPREGRAHVLRDLTLALGMTSGARGFDVHVRSGQALVDGSLPLRSLAGRLSLAGERVGWHGVTVETPRSAIRLDGHAELGSSPGAVDVRLQATPLTAADLSVWWPPASTSPASATLDLRFSGPLDAIDVEGTVNVGPSVVSLALRAAALERPRRIGGTLELRDVDVSSLTGDAEHRTRLTGVASLDVRFDERGPAGRFSVDATDVLALETTADAVRMQGVLEHGRLAIQGHVERAGATATADGVVSGIGTSDALAFDLHGTFRRVDLRALPAVVPGPRLESLLSGTYRVSGPTPLRASTVLGESAIEGARLQAGTSIELARSDQRIQLGVDSRLEHLDPARLGRALRLPALADSRMAGRVNGQVHLTASGPDLAHLDVEAIGHLADSALAFARLPNLAYAVRVSPDRIAAHLEGEALDVRPARLGIAALEESTLSGRLDVDVTVSRRSTAPTGRVAVEGSVALADSTLLGVPIEVGTLAGRYHGQSAVVDRLEIEGPQVRATAKGTVAVGGVGETDLSLDAAVTDLSVLQARVGRPLAGSLSTHGRAHGRDGDVRVEGEFTGARLGIDSTRALGAHGTYRADVRRWQRDSLALQADVSASSAEVAGVEISSARVTGSYSDDEADFEAAAAVGHRDVRAAGRLALDGTERVLTLRELAVGTGPLVWTLDPASSPVLRQRADAVELDGLAVVRGDQRITLRGRLPLADGRVALDAVSLVEATARRVRLADVVPLARLAPNAPGGVATGALRLGGPLRSPEGGLRLVIDGAEVRPGLTLERVEANASVGHGQVIVDAQVLQQPGAVLDAKGRVPWASLLDAGDASASDMPLDLTVSTDGVPAALVEAITGQVSAVEGTLSGRVSARGTIGHPRLEGALALTGGAFRIEPTGSSYADAQADVRFLGDRVEIAAASLADEDGDRLQARGHVGVDGLALTGVAVSLEADRFEVLDNDLGEVEVHASLEAGGTLASPRVTGDVTLQTARIEIDELLERLGRRPSPRPTAAGTNGTGIAGTPAEASSGPSFDLRLRAPDNLVVRGRNLRRHPSAAAFGDVNLTVGGQLEVRREAGADEVAVLGSLHAVRGFYAFQGRRFEVDRDSEVRFIATQPTDPALRITARREISGIDTQVHVRGRLSRPEVTLSSNPPLDQSDILSLIVFNQPANALGAGERASLAARTATLAAGALTGPLADSVARALDLDHVELRVASDEGRPSVGLGEQIGDRAYVGYEQQFGAGDVGRLTFEYRLTDFLRLVTSVATGGSEARGLERRVEAQTIDLFFVWVY